MKHQEHDDVRNRVRDAYTHVAEANNEGDCCGVESSCCGVSDDDKINTLISTRLGYSEADLALVPDGADMGLGCGNPKAFADMRAGEVVIDLGCGGGFDAFLAAHEVGPTGHVIGIDMTPAMVSKARANVDKGQYNNVEIRLGEIEHLPVADNTADVIISNCVINLSPLKERVFAEAFRVLKPGGRLAISDVVASGEMPAHIKEDLHLHNACISGASSIDILTTLLHDSGFIDISIEPKDESREFISDWAPGLSVDDYVLSAIIKAKKPAP